MMVLNKFVKNDGGRLAEYNIKDLKKNQSGDCVIRAIAIAMEQPYKQTLIELCEYAVKYGSTPTSEWVFKHYLKDRGWVEQKPLYYPDGHLKGGHRRQLKHFDDRRWVGNTLVSTRGHLQAIKNGTIHDTWYHEHSVTGKYWKKNGWKTTEGYVTFEM